jgi:hypothetical protein
MDRMSDAARPPRSEPAIAMRPSALLGATQAVVQLQRTAGNRAVVAAIQSGSLRGALARSRSAGSVAASSLAVGGAVPAGSKARYPVAASGLRRPSETRRACGVARALARDSDAQAINDPPLIQEDDIWWSDLKDIWGWITRDKWSCDASCNVEGTEPQCTGRVTGSASGPSQEHACREAKRDATQKAPRGCYARHCQCKNCTDR